MSPGRTRFTGLRGSLIVGLIAFLGLGLTTIAAPAAIAADPTAAMTITKTASADDVIPGQAFEYSIDFQGTAGTVSGCVDATLTDPLPDYLEIVGAPTVSGGAAGTSTVTASGTTVSVKFNAPLGGGDIG